MPVIFARQSQVYRAVLLSDPEAAETLRTWIQEISPETEVPESPLPAELVEAGMWMLRSPNNDIIMVPAADFLIDFEEIPDPMDGFERLLKDSAE